VKIKHSVVTDHAGLSTVWIHNHSAKVPVYKSNDPYLLKARVAEIEADCKKSGNRIETLLALYKWGKDHGCVTVMRPVRAARGLLTIKPEGDKWILVLARGKSYIIIKRDADRAKIREKYMELLDLKTKDPTLLDTMWKYALAKQKLELEEIEQ
jgi:hypothetical protein